MPDFSINAPQKQGKTFSDWVWFEGATALKEGQGVCFNWDFGTAASADARRYNRVELPTILNARHFAGVASRDYSAQANGQLIEVYRPGSVCNVLSKASNTIGVGLTTCIAGGTYAGYFQYAGFEGEGSGVPLQTIDRSSTAGKCLVALQVGKPSGLVQVRDGTVGGAQTDIMVGGVTVFPALTRSGSALTFSMADGTIAGMRKKFLAAGTQTTYGVTITVAGINLANSALNTVAIVESGDEATYEWNGDWYEVGNVAATTN